MEDLKSLLTIPQHSLETGEWIANVSSGVIFKGIWRKEGEKMPVALKKMRISSAETIAGIATELKIMKDHQFENVCKVYGGCLANKGEQVWLVMEYVEGDLHNYLTKYTGTLPPDLQISFCIQATKAIHALHASPSLFIHRDVKALNFLVKNNSKLLLADFSSSITTAMLPSLPSSTICAARWVAPEIIQTGTPHWSEKADIYSIGALFYEIVTQALPYHEDSNLKVILKQIKAGILPTIPDHCPKTIANAIHQCWNANPSQRPSANELLQLLEGPPQILDPITESHKAKSNSTELLKQNATIKQAKPLSSTSSPNQTKRVPILSTASASSSEGFRTRTRSKSNPEIYPALLFAQQLTISETPRKDEERTRNRTFSDASKQEIERKGNLEAQKNKYASLKRSDPEKREQDAEAPRRRASISHTFSHLKKAITRTISSSKLKRSNEEAKEQTSPRDNQQNESTSPRNESTSPRNESVSPRKVIAVSPRKQRPVSPPKNNNNTQSIQQPQSNQLDIRVEQEITPPPATVDSSTQSDQPSSIASERFKYLISQKYSSMENVQSPYLNTIRTTWRARAAAQKSLQSPALQK